jgi:hypothetical protein
MGLARQLGAAFLIAGLVLPVGAMAQVIIDAPSITGRKTPDARLPDVKPAPLAWPRLDPGAVLCRTEGDLERLAARRQGEEGTGPADCRLVNGPTAVTIMQRRGPGRTQVRLTDAPTISGWTDVWLPDKAPVGATRQAGR